MDFDFPLTDRVALVTGAASGIGEAIARAYAGKGAKIALCDLDRDRGRSGWPMQWTPRP